MKQCLSKKIMSFILMAVVFAGCSAPAEFTAVFRGDSPLFFNVTSMIITEGDIAPFTLELRTAPSTDVKITLAASDGSQISIEPTELIFTKSNYNQAQTIRVLGKDDCIADGTQDVTIETSSITSGDSAYNNIPNVTIPVSVKDGVDILPKIVFFQNSELITSELGTIAFFKVNLSCPPTANVTVPLVTDKTGEVATDKISLTFTPADYSTYQTVTLTGLSDCVLDSDQAFTIKSGNVVSTDTRFSRYNTTASGLRSVVTGTNLNYAVVSDTNISLPPGSLDVTLKWNTGVAAHVDPFISFSVSLTCPIQNTIYLSFNFTKYNAKSFAMVNNTSLGNTYLVFNSTNWNMPQNVLIGLNSAVLPAELQTGGYPASIPAAAPYYFNNNLSSITMYQSQGDPAQTALVSPAYNNKIIYPNITIQSW